MSLNLKKAREAKGLTQQQVADLIGVTRESYARYENGTRNPNLQNLSDLADLLNVTTDYLLGRTDLSDMNISEIDMGDGRIGTLYSKERKNLSPEEREQVKRLVQQAQETGVSTTVALPGSTLSAEDKALVERIAPAIREIMDQRITEFLADIQKQSGGQS